jgi:hypothetical protein
MKIPEYEKRIVDYSRFAGTGQLQQPSKRSID